MSPRRSPAQRYLEKDRPRRRHWRARRHVAIDLIPAKATAFVCLILCRSTEEVVVVDRFRGQMGSPAMGAQSSGPPQARVCRRHTFVCLRRAASSPEGRRGGGNWGRAAPHRVGPLCGCRFVEGSSSRRRRRRADCILLPLPLCLVYLSPGGSRERMTNDKNTKYEYYISKATGFQLGDRDRDRDQVWC